jgi:hypothetical protein
VVSAREDLAAMLGRALVHAPLDKPRSNDRQGRYKVLLARAEAVKQQRLEPSEQRSLAHVAVSAASMPTPLPVNGENTMRAAMARERPHIERIHPHRLQDPSLPLHPTAVCAYTGPLLCCVVVHPLPLNNTVFSFASIGLQMASRAAGRQSRRSVYEIFDRTLSCRMSTGFSCVSCVVPIDNMCDIFSIRALKMYLALAPYRQDVKLPPHNQFRRRWLMGAPDYIVI